MFERNMKKNELINGIVKTRNMTYLTLFSSGGTIVCCAIPAALVALGAGATLSTFIHYFPQIVVFSVYKVQIFVGAFVMLTIGWGAFIRSKKFACPADVQLAKTCQKLRQHSWVVLIISSLTYFLGLLFAFLLPAIN